MPLWLLSMARTGVDTTSIVAYAGDWLGPALVSSPLAGITFSKLPAWAPVTATAMVQPPGGMLAALAYCMVLLPGTAVTLSRVQVPASPLGLATLSVPGRVSVRTEARVMALALPLPRVRVNRDVSPTLMVVGLKDFATVGGCSTVRVFVAGAVFVTPCVVTRALAGMVFS